MEAPFPCLEGIEDNLDNCVELGELVHLLVEEDLSGTAGEDTGLYRLPGSQPLDSKVWQVRDVAQTMWKPCE